MEKWSAGCSADYLNEGLNGLLFAVSVAFPHAARLGVICSPPLHDPHGRVA
jgi:hypothetical protein